MTKSEYTLHSQQNVKNDDQVSIQKFLSSVAVDPCKTISYYHVIYIKQKMYYAAYTVFTES